MDQETKEILLDLLKSMKYRTAAVFELGSDVEGLKATLPEASRGTFAENAGIARATSRIAFEGEMRLLDEAIERLSELQQWGDIIRELEKATATINSWAKSKAREAALESSTTQP